MSMPAVGPFPLGHDDRPPQDHAAVVAGQLLDLAGQIRRWQHALASTFTQAETLAELFAAEAGPGTANPPPDPAGRVAGIRQVCALVTTLAADAGTVTWLSIRTGQEPCLASGADASWTGPLLTRTEPVRVLVCAPSTEPARALADANRGASPSWLRMARFGGEPRGICGDLLVSTGTKTIAVVRDLHGIPYADEVSGVAINALLRAMLDSLWNDAAPFVHAERIEAMARQPVKMEILDLLEAGAKDEAIARALGLSLRTCRRHIAELLSVADAGSRFQAACRFTRAGLLGAGASFGAETAKRHVPSTSTAGGMFR